LKIYLFYSFLLHALILLYLLSLPIYRGGIHLQSFGDYFVHLISEKGISSHNSSLKYNISKSNEGNLGKAKEVKIDLKTEDIDVKESTQPLEEEKTSISDTESKLPIKQTEIETEGEAVEVEKPFNPAGGDNTLKEESPAKKEKDKKEVYEAKEIKKTELIVQKSLPVESYKEPPKTAELAVMPEKYKIASFELITDKTIVPHLQERKRESIFLKSEEKLAVTKKNDQHEIAFNKQEAPKKTAEVKKPSKTSEIGRVSGKKASSQKGRKLEKAEEPDSKVFLKSETGKTLSAISKEVTSKDIYDKKKVAKNTSQVKEADIKKNASPQDKLVQGIAPSDKTILGGTTHASTLPKADVHIAFDSMPDNKVMHAMDIKDEGRPVVEIFTSEKNRTPSQEDYFIKKEDRNKQTIIEISPEQQKEKKPPLGIPLSDIILLKDIKIEIFSHSTDMSGIVVHLLKKAHPMANTKYDSEKAMEVDGLEEKSETYIEDTPRVKKSFSVSKGKRAVYIFLMENKANTAYKADIVFRLFEGSAGERIKDIKSLELSPHAIVKFKFILPEAVFWDDEYYFTGTIESSDTLTKFNEKTGLIWKEGKEY
jgi:hypothetical protein